MDKKKVAELIEDMAQGYATNFRSSGFFNDWTKEECQEVANIGSRMSKTWKDGVYGAIWGMVSLLASYLVLEYNKIEEELNRK